MEIKVMKSSEMRVEEPFVSLFPVGADTLDSIRIDMDTNGFDEAFPIIVWKEKNVIVDGHTRFTAAMLIELEEVPVLFRSFENEDDAILYAFHLQRNRRNLADEDILRCLQVLDSIQPPSGRRNGEEGPALSKKETAELRAKELGTSASKIDKARKVLENGTDDIKDAVSSGDKSINKAFNEMQESRRESGELKGRTTTGLACGARYNKALGKLMEEISKIKEDGWNEISIEKALLDVETLKNIIES